MGKAGLRALSLAGAALVMSGCSSSPQPPTPPLAQAPTPVAPPPAPVQRADQCGAAESQHLVGRPRSEIPVPVDPARQRVACTTCPVTQDFRADRLNFFFDAETGIIREVRCG